jgi:dihydrofolate reductase
MAARVCAVAAIGRNRELGKDGKLLWRIPDDLKRFRELTRGHPVVMGRKTFESIVSYLGHPLPERTNIVVTRGGHNDIVSRYGDVVVAGSVEEGIKKAKTLDAEEIHIGGGAQIYERALPHIDKLYLTIVDDSKEADSFFPPYDDQFTKKVFEEKREWNGLKYRWVNLERG